MRIYSVTIQTLHIRTHKNRSLAQLKFKNRLRINLQQIKRLCMPPMHTCNNYSSCIGLLNLLGMIWEKKKRKTCVKQFWKELNHVTNLEFGKKCWLAKEELQREDWPHNWKPHLPVLCCREIWLNLKLKVEKKEKIYMKTIEKIW